MKNFKEYLLKDCIELIIDHRGKTPAKMGGTWVDNGVRVISALNVHNGSIDNVDQIRCVSEEVYKRWMSEDVKRNDCFIASEGASLGENCIWDSDEKIVLGQRLYALRTNPEILDPWYFACYMQTNKFRTQIEQISTGSTVFGISQPVLLSVKLVLPEINQQRVIGELYKNLKRKIENNNQCNAELEQMARTIYDYWFLQFDFPDENGKPYKSSGGKMVWNEELKREIPEGWKSTILQNVAECLDSYRMPLSNAERVDKKGNIPYYGATGIIDFVDESLFEGDYILMAEDGSVMDEKGNPILQRITGKAWVNNHAHILRPIKKHGCKLLMMMLKDIPVMKIKTGSIQMKINQENMNKIVLPEIPEKLVDSINTILNNIDTQILHKKKENQELTSLRDFLLPLLMNGQVEFKEH